MMRKIYVWAAHTSYSPGCMCGGRNEHSDVLKFAKAVVSELKRYGDIEVELRTGNVKPVCEKDAVLLIFHRDYNEENDTSHGCRVYVQRAASAQIQYEAFRLLTALCRGGFRYKGVHEGYYRKGFEFIENTGCDRTFLFTLGYLDSEKDNRILDKRSEFLCRSLCDELENV